MAKTGMIFLGILLSVGLVVGTYFLTIYLAVSTKQFGPIPTQVIVAQPTWTSDSWSAAADTDLGVGDGSCDFNVLSMGPMKNLLMACTISIFDAGFVVFDAGTIPTPHVPVSATLFTQDVFRTTVIEESGGFQYTIEVVFFADGSLLLGTESDAYVNFVGNAGEPDPIEFLPFLDPFVGDVIDIETGAFTYANTTAAGPAPTLYIPSTNIFSSTARKHFNSTRVTSMAGATAAAASRLRKAAVQNQLARRGTPVPTPAPVPVASP